MCLPRRTARTVELLWNLQMRGRKPDPLTADIVHVRENRGNAARLARRFGAPGRRVKMFDEHLIHALIGGKNPDCSSDELIVNLGFTLRHGDAPTVNKY